MFIRHQNRSGRIPQLEQRHTESRNYKTQATGSKIQERHTDTPHQATHRLNLLLKNQPKHNEVTCSQWTIYSLKRGGESIFFKDQLPLFWCGGGINYHLIFSSRTVGSSLLGLGYIWPRFFQLLSPNHSTTNQSAEISEHMGYYTDTEGLINLAAVKMFYVCPVCILHAC